MDLDSQQAERKCLFRRKSEINKYIWNMNIYLASWLLFGGTTRYAHSIQVDAWYNRVQRAPADDSRGVSALIGWCSLQGYPTLSQHNHIFSLLDILWASARHRLAFNELSHCACEHFTHGDPWSDRKFAPDHTLLSAISKSLRLKWKFWEYI